MRSECGTTSQLCRRPRAGPFLPLGAAPMISAPVSHGRLSCRGFSETPSVHSGVVQTSQVLGKSFGFRSCLLGTWNSPCTSQASVLFFMCQKVITFLTGQDTWQALAKCPWSLCFLSFGTACARALVSLRGGTASGE